MSTADACVNDTLILLTLLSNGNKGIDDILIMLSSADEGIYDANIGF